MSKYYSQFNNFSSAFDDAFGSFFSYCSQDKFESEVKENEIVLKVDIPGVNKDDLKLNFEYQKLTIEAKRSDKDYTYKYEWKVNVSVDASKIKAKLDLGVLTIIIPKSKAQKSNINVE